MTDPVATLDELVACLCGRLKAPRDWTAVVQLACETLTVGSFASTVLASELNSEVPDSVRALLVEVQERALERNSRLKEQLVEMLPALNRVGVEPIVMRGMAVLLESPADRSRLLADIDILVPHECRQEAVQALSAIGYEIHQGFHGPPHSVVLGRVETSAW